MAKVYARRRQTLAVTGPVSTNGRLLDYLLPVLKSLRPHQWSKNALLFLPAIFAHTIWVGPTFRGCILSFFCFSLCASSVYLFNDLIDLDRDRKHPEKRHRPFASGSIPLWFGYSAIPLLCASAIGLSAAFLPKPFVIFLLAYSGLTLIYSLFLNREPIVDVLLLTSFYVIRLLAGGAAVNVKLSPWFLAFFFFFFLGLAFLKRYVELEKWSHQKGKLANRAGYVLGDRWILQTTGVTSGFLSIVVFCLYLNSPDVIRLYSHPGWLWGICPLLAYWVCHIWFLAQRGIVNTDPVVFALRDKMSFATGASMALLLWLSA